MFCKNCGKQIEVDSKFCQYCGQSLIDTNTSNPAVPNYTLNTNYNSIPTQPMVNNYSSMPNNSAQQQNGNPILVMMVVVFMLLAVAIPVVVFLVGDNDDSTVEKESGKEEVEIPEYPDIEQPDIEEPNNPSVDNGNTKIVNHDGYNYTISTNYISEDYDGNFVVYDNSASWILMFSIAEYPYETYKNNIKIVDAELSSTYDNVTTEFKKYQNTEYIETDLISEGMPMRMLYFSVDSDTTVLVMLMTLSETASLDSLFNIAYPIIVSIEEDNTHVL